MPTELRYALHPGEVHHDAYYRQSIEAYATPGSQLLDLGCGDNSAMSHLRTGTRQVWGADIERHPDLHDPAWFKLLGSDGSIPFADNSFDVVTAGWVLEHLRDSRKFFQEVNRVLKPGGRFVALTVHSKHYVTWISRFFGLLPHVVSQRIIYHLYGRAVHDTHPTYFRVNTKPAVQRASRASGLQLADFRSFHCAGYFRFFDPLYRAAQRFDASLDRVSPDLGCIYLVTTLCKPKVVTKAMRRAA